MGGVAERHHAVQAQIFAQAQQLLDGGAVDRPHDAATHTVRPGGVRHIGKGKSGIGIIAAGQAFILADSYKQYRGLIRFGLALLRRQVSSPVHQRLHFGNHLRALHQHIFQRLAVGTAAGNAGGLHNFPGNGRFHRLLFKAAVGAAGFQKFHYIHGGSHSSFCCFGFRPRRCLFRAPPPVFAFIIVHSAFFA